MPPDDTAAATATASREWGEPVATFVLVHGSFHGGWCWREVAPRLRERGHKVHAPTLTGLGERSHLVSPRVGLSTHVRDVVQVLEYRNLEDVVLVGHSYGGMVVTGAAEAAADRLARLVYLDGFVPEHGASCWDVIDGSGWAERAAAEGFGWLVPPVDPETTYGIADPDVLAWMRERLVPTTMLTHEEPLWAPDGRAATLPRTYISCLQNDTFRGVAEAAREAGFDYHELDTGHDAMLTAPEDLATILAEAGEALD